MRQLEDFGEINRVHGFRKVMKSASVLVLDITTFLLPQPVAGV